MIRNLLVIDTEGNNLLAANFGECHSLGTQTELIGSFVSAIYSFGQTIIGQEIRNIRFENLDFMVLARNEFIFMISADDGATPDNRRKLARISSLFIERHGGILEHYKRTDKTPELDGFIEYLHQLDITQHNCGGRPSCADCPDHRVLPLEEMAKIVNEETISH